MERKRGKNERTGAQAKLHFDKKGYNHIEKSSDKMCMEKNMWLVWDRLSRVAVGMNCTAKCCVIRILMIFLI